MLFAEIVNTAPQPNWDHLSLLLTCTSVLLACVAIVLALAGVFAFIHFQNIAKLKAEEVATIQAVKKAQEVASEYLTKNLSELVGFYVKMRVDEFGEADRIALSQDNENDR
jgi:uncharacterized protein (UPF0333 family)